MSVSVTPPIARDNAPAALALIALGVAGVAAASVLVSPLVCAAIVLGACALAFAAVKIEAVLLAWIAVGAALPAIRLLPYEGEIGFGFTLGGEFLLVFMPAALYQLLIARRYGARALAPFWPVILYALSTVAFLPWAADVSSAVRRSAYWVAFLLFAAIAYHYGRRADPAAPNSPTRRVVTAIAVATLLICALSAVQLVFGIGIEHPGKGLVRGVFDHKNILGYFLVTVLPLSVAMNAVAKGMRRIAWFALNGIICLTLFFSLSRAAWLAGIAALLAVAFFMSREKRWQLSVGLSALGVVTVACAWLLLNEDLHGPSFSFRSFVTSRAVDLGSYSTRVQVWQGLLYFVSRHPGQWWFGHGTGAAAQIINSASYMPHVNSTHNIYLRLFVENGLVGLAFFLALAAWLLRRLLACRRACEAPIDRALCTGAIGAFIAHLVFNFGGDEFIGMTVTPYLWVIAGLAFAAAERARRRAAEALDVLPSRLSPDDWPALLAVGAPRSAPRRPANRVSSRNGGLAEGK